MNASVDERGAIMLEAFRAVEQPDERRLQELYDREVEFGANGGPGCAAVSRLARRRADSRHALDNNNAPRPQASAERSPRAIVSRSSGRLVFHSIERSRLGRPRRVRMVRE